MAKAKSRSDNLTFALILPPGGAAEANKHVPHYSQKGLLREYATVADVADAIGVSENALLETFAVYTKIAEVAVDPFGKVFTAAHCC